MSEQQKDPGQPLLARIEKLINQIFFVTNVPRQQICHEQVGKRVFPVKHFHHGLLIDSHHRATGHRSCGAQAERLPGKASFSEEIALLQNADGGFLSDQRHNGESYLSFLYIKNSIGQVALNKDRLLLGKSFDLPTTVDSRKECLGIEFAASLGRYHECHVGPLSGVPIANQATSYDVRDE